MAYKNGKKILPSHLLEAIQEYIDGEYIYIPRKSDSKKLWGEDTNIKNLILERNIEIFNKYLSGISVKELSNEYYLSPKTIYGILSKTKNS